MAQDLIAYYVIGGIVVLVGIVPWLIGLIEKAISWIGNKLQTSDNKGTISQTKNISNAFKELREATSGAWDKCETNEDINKIIGRDND